MVDKSELKAELEKSLASGEMTERFYGLAVDVVCQFVSAKKVDGDMRDLVRDSFVSWLMGGWRSIDPKGNPFSFITGRAQLIFMRVLDKRKRGTQYRADVRGVGLPAGKISEVLRSLPENARFKKVHVISGRRTIIVDYFNPDDRQKNIRVEVEF